METTSFGPGLSELGGLVVIFVLYWFLIAAAGVPLVYIFARAASRGWRDSMK